ncbi:PAS domain-containing protein [Dongia soli]|uniref:PAS domain-containing protein n=1 Tax=Dongia soli TaxID=600628 RepID=A0ABU5E5L1_9PROT|nr:PAS domain-containing protein [Dongia soli]MDY0881429.1 PAS domain-containing protein [Dongia soli]
MIYDFRDPGEQELALALNPLFPLAYDYWLRLSESRLPRREEIDPIAVASILSNVMLLDVLEGGQDFRYRLAGSTVEANFGGSLKGVVLSDILKEFPSFEPIIDVKRRCAATASPYTCDKAVFTHFGTLKRVNCFAMPLSDDSQGVSHLFAIGILEPASQT